MNFTVTLKLIHKPTQSKTEIIAEKYSKPFRIRTDCIYILLNFPSVIDLTPPIHFHTNCPCGAAKSMPRCHQIPYKPFLPIIIQEIITPNPKYKTRFDIPLPSASIRLFYVPRQGISTWGEYLPETLKLQNCPYLPACLMLPEAHGCVCATTVSRRKFCLNEGISVIRRMCVQQLHRYRYYFR